MLYLLTTYKCYAQKINTQKAVHFTCNFSMFDTALQIVYIIIKNKNTNDSFM